MWALRDTVALLDDRPDHQVVALGSSIVQASPVEVVVLAPGVGSGIEEDPMRRHKCGDNSSSIPWFGSTPDNKARHEDISSGIMIPNTPPAHPSEVRK